jgi:hypothetical protein
VALRGVFRRGSPEPPSPPRAGAQTDHDSAQSGSRAGGDPVGSDGIGKGGVQLVNPPALVLDQLPLDLEAVFGLLGSLRLGTKPALGAFDLLPQRGDRAVSDLELLAECPDSGGLFLVSGLSPGHPDMAGHRPALSGQSSGHPNRHVAYGFCVSSSGTIIRTTPSFPTCRGQWRLRTSLSAHETDIPLTAASSA